MFFFESLVFKAFPESQSSWFSCESSIFRRCVDADRNIYRFWTNWNKCTASCPDSAMQCVTEFSEWWKHTNTADGDWQSLVMHRRLLTCHVYSTIRTYATAVPDILISYSSSTILSMCSEVWDTIGTKQFNRTKPQSETFVTLWPNHSHQSIILTVVNI